MISVRLDAQGMMKGETIIVHNPHGFTLGIMPEGMLSGKPSVSISIQDPTTKGWVIAECSLMELQSAMRMVQARYGMVVGD